MPKNFKTIPITFDLVKCKNRLEEIDVWIPFLEKEITEYQKRIEELKEERKEIEYEEGIKE